MNTQHTTTRDTDKFIAVPSDDEEYCCNCGTGLSRHERFLCYDCQQNEWYTQDQEREASFALDEYDELAFLMHYFGDEEATA